MKYIFTLLLFSYCANSFAQSSPNDYVFSTNATATLYNMSNADTLIGGGADNITDDVRILPFVFACMGDLHNSFKVGTNGILYLSSDYYQIAPMHIDGNGVDKKWSGKTMGISKNGAIVCKTFGNAPSRQFVVSFEKMCLNKRTGNEDATFQVALHESSGVIQFIYGSMAASDTIWSMYDPMISKTSANQHRIVNTSSHTSSYTTSYPWGGTINPGVLTSLNSTGTNSCRTYLFTPPPIANFIDTTLVVDTVVSGVAQTTIPEHQPGYLYYYYLSKSPSGPFSYYTRLTSNVFQGMPDSTVYYRIYRSNGAAVATNYASGTITYGTPRKFTSQNNGFWIDNTTWGAPTAHYPVWGDTVIISQGDTVKLSSFSTSSALELEVKGVLDYGNVLTNPVVVNNLKVDTNGLVNVHNRSSVANANFTSGGTLVIYGNITGAGKVDMRYNNCRLQIRSTEAIPNHTISVNFEKGNNNIPLLNSLTLSTANDVQLLTPLTINKEIRAEYGHLTTNNNLTINKNAGVGTQTTPSDFKIYRYDRNAMFSGNVNYAAGTLPQLYYMGNYVFKSINAPFTVSSFVAGNEVPVSDSVERLYVYTNAGVDFNDPVTITHTMEWQNGHVNMVNGDDFIFAGNSFYYDGGGIRTNGWVKYFQYQYPYTGLMDVPGNSNIYPIIANGAKRFAFLQGALAADGFYSVKHTAGSGTTALTTPFTENGNTFSKRSNSYWQTSSPTGTEFINNAFHFRAGDMDSITNAQLTAVCYANGAAAGTHLPSLGGKAAPVAGRTGLNNINIGVNNFYIALADANPLSTDLISFNGTKKEGGNLLEWNVSNHHNLMTFELQRSHDGKTFGQLDIIAVNDQQSAYAYLDRHPVNGTNYYRVKMEDQSMKQSYSNIIMLYTPRINHDIYCFPNPATQSLNIQVNADVAAETHYSVFSVEGKLVKQGTLQIVKGDNLFSIDFSQLSTGSYFFKTDNGFFSKIIKE